MQFISAPAHLGRLIHGYHLAGGVIIGEPLRSGEGEVIADLDFTLIDQQAIDGFARGRNCCTCGSTEHRPATSVSAMLTR